MLPAARFFLIHATLNVYYLKKERLDAISAVMPSIWLLILYLLFMYLSSSIW